MANVKHNTVDINVRKLLECTETNNSIQWGISSRKASPTKDPQKIESKPLRKEICSNTWSFLGGCSFSQVHSEPSHYWLMVNNGNNAFSHCNDSHLMMLEEGCLKETQHLLRIEKWMFCYLVVDSQIRILCLNRDQKLNHTARKEARLMLYIGIYST